MGHPMGHPIGYPMGCPMRYPMGYPNLYVHIASSSQQLCPLATPRACIRVKMAPVNSKQAKAKAKPAAAKPAAKGQGAKRPPTESLQSLEEGQLALGLPRVESLVLNAKGTRMRNLLIYRASAQCKKAHGSFQKSMQQNRQPLL